MSQALTAASRRRIWSIAGERIARIGGEQRVGEQEEREEDRIGETLTEDKMLDRRKGQTQPRTGAAEAGQAAAAGKAAAAAAGRIAAVAGKAAAAAGKAAAAAGKAAAAAAGGSAWTWSSLVSLESL